jgi:hypothetical protein
MMKIPGNIGTGDLGPNGIEAFVKHHLKVCHENNICNRLSMQDMEFEHTVVQGTLIRPRSLTKSPEQRKKAKTAPHRVGTSNSLFTVEAFLKLNDFTRLA